jgi:hypothetical protein
MWFMYGQRCDSVGITRMALKYAAQVFYVADKSDESYQDYLCLKEKNRLIFETAAQQGTIKISMPNRYVSKH